MQGPVALFSLSSDITHLAPKQTKRCVFLVLPPITEKSFAFSKLHIQDPAALGQTESLWVLPVISQFLLLVSLISILALFLFVIYHVFMVAF